MVESVRGPMLLDLSELFDTSVKAISQSVFWAALGAMMGTLACKLA